MVYSVERWELIIGGAEFVNKLNDMTTSDNDMEFYVDVQELPEDFYQNLYTDPEGTTNNLMTAVNNVYNKKVQVIYRNFSAPLRAYKKRIHQIRSKEINKILVFDGLVRTSTDVLPRVKTAAYEHIDCGNVMYVDQDKDEDVYPDLCSLCNEDLNENKVNFREDLSTYEDYQTVQIEEEPEGLKGRQPERMECQFHGSFTKEHLRVGVGERVCILAVFKIRKKGRRVVHEKFAKVIGIETKGKNYEDYIVSDSDVAIFEAMSKDENLLEQLALLVAPNIAGLETVKQSLVLQMFGGNFFSPERRRGDIHIGLIGDPGVGKSKISNAIAEIAPHVIRASGAPSTSVGLTAAAIPNPQGGFILEAGAAVLADRGVFIIDEFDKMKDDVRGALHEIMEDQTVTVAKGGITATLIARCAVLAIMNPKYNRFESNQSVASQINLPPSLLSRFDLIFAMKDTVNETRDREIASAVFKGREGEKPDTKYKTEDFTKYIIYARSKVREMHIIPEAKRILTEKYISLRKMNRTNDAADENIPVTARQLEGVARLAEAHAKMRLSSTVEEIDAEIALRILDYFIKTMCVDDTGAITTDQALGGKSQSEKKKADNLYSTLVGIAEEDMWINQYTTEELINRTKTTMNKIEFNTALEQLRSMNLIFGGENRIKIRRP